MPESTTEKNILFQKNYLEFNMAKKIQSKLYTLSEIATLLSAKIDTNTRKKMHSVYKTLYNLVNQEKRNEYGREHGKLYRKKQSEKTKTALKLYSKFCTKSSE